MVNGVTPMLCRYGSTKPKITFEGEVGYKPPASFAAWNGDLSFKIKAEYTKASTAGGKAEVSIHGTSTSDVTELFGIKQLKMSPQSIT